MYQQNRLDQNTTALYSSQVGNAACGEMQSSEEINLCCEARFLTFRFMFFGSNAPQHWFAVIQNINIRTSRTQRTFFFVLELSKRGCSAIEPEPSYCYMTSTSPLRVSDYLANTMKGVRSIDLNSRVSDASHLLYMSNLTRTTMRMCSEQSANSTYKQIETIIIDTANRRRWDGHGTFSCTCNMCMYLILKK